MRKYFPLGLLFILAIIVFSAERNRQENTQLNQDQYSERATPTESDLPMDNTESNPTESSKYLEYYDGIEENYGDKNIIYFFYANWCPTCRPVDQELRKLQNTIPDDFVIIRVNYNDADTDKSEIDLAKKLNITYQHTFVAFDSQRNEIERWNGGDFTKIKEITK